MTSSRPQKKSEKLEVRVTPDEKQALQLEARATKTSVSELVRQILNKHIRTQPFLYQAVRSAHDHRRKLLSGTVAMMSALVAYLVLLPSAHTEKLTVEMLGKIESGIAPEPITVHRFASRLELETDGSGKLVLSNDHRPLEFPGLVAAPTSIEVQVVKPAEYQQPNEAPVYYLSMKFIEKTGDEIQVAATPSLVVAENSLGNIEFGAESGIQYTISAKIDAD